MFGSPDISLAYDSTARFLIHIAELQVRRAIQTLGHFGWLCLSQSLGNASIAQLQDTLGPQRHENTQELFLLPVPHVYLKVISCFTRHSVLHCYCGCQFIELL